MEFEEKCTKDMDQEGSNSLYHKYTMVSVGDDGVIFAKYGATSFTNYVCSTSAPSFTEQTVAFNNDVGALTGEQEDTSATDWDWAAVTLI